MKLRFFLTISITSFIFFHLSQSVNAQNNNISSRKGITITCYGSEKDAFSYRPLSKKIRQAIHARTAENQSKIEVSYNGFPQDAQAAFQFAVDIWESLLASPIPIRINANWTSLESGTLGSAGASSFFQNFEGVNYNNTWYPTALAEKLARKELNQPGAADIVAQFNSNRNWYLGTDANPPAGEFDLVSVVLHEIGHGLGFFDTFALDNNQGLWGLSGIPVVYDLFVENQNGQLLVDTALFDNPSTRLGNQLTSKALFFNSPLATQSAGAVPELYAPNPFSSGSSIAHLDESRYPAGSPNSLMTPQLGTAESNHEVGELLLNIFAEMGWINTNIVHDPIIDTETFDQPFLILAKVISDTLFFDQTLVLNYTTNDFQTTQTLPLTPTGNADEFSATIPTNNQAQMLSYYISVNDATNRTFTAPAQAPEFVYTFTAGPDTIAPIINHEPINFILPNEPEVVLSAEVTDNFPLDTVFVEYSINQILQPSFGLSSGDPDQYEGQFQFSTGSIEVGDTISYRIVARDSTSNQNLAFNPKEGFYKFPVDNVASAQNSYQNDFETPNIDFIGNVFEITTLTGFNNSALHSQHPYLNGSGPNNESNYIHQLRVPIIIQSQNPVITFKEIVLVEPGEPGSVFGDAEFWDYVVVEGSNDGGTTWTPLLDGYDSRVNPVWLNRYNSNLIGSNSLALADSNLYQSRTIVLTDTFSVGEEILLRFRQFADEAAFGWGWVIDDLNVQGEVVTGIDQPFAEPQIAIFPNPSTGWVQIRVSAKNDRQPIKVAVLNAVGRKEVELILPNNTENTQRSFDLSTLLPGIYIVKIEVGGKTYTQKLLLTH